MQLFLAPAFHEQAERAAFLPPAAPKKKGTRELAAPSLPSSPCHPFSPLGQSQPVRCQHTEGKGRLMAGHESLPPGPWAGLKVLSKRQALGAGSRGQENPTSARVGNQRAESSSEASRSRQQLGPRGHGAPAGRTGFRNCKRQQRLGQRGALRLGSVLKMNPDLLVARTVDKRKEITLAARC